MLGAMTVDSETLGDSYVGTGAVDTYDYTFRIQSEDDLRVVVADLAGAETVLVLDTDYTVDGVGDADGGTITLTDPLTADYAIHLRPYPALTQPSSFRNQTANHRAALENALDRIVQCIQRVAHELSRCIRTGETVDPDDFTLTLPEPSAGDLIGWNDDEDGLVNITPGSVELAIPASDSVGTSQLVNLAVTTGKLNDLAVTVGKLAANAVTTAKIADNNVTLAKLVETLGILDYGNEIAVTGAVTATIGRMHKCTGTSADYTVALPAVSGNAGKVIGFRMGSAAALTKLVTLDGDGSETIDGATTRVMWANEVAILLCDGTEWRKIGGKSIPMMGSITRTGLPQSITEDLETKVTSNATLIDGGMTISSGMLTVRRGGIYQASIGATMNTGQVAEQLELYLKVNQNNADNYPRSGMEAGSASVFPMLSASSPITLAAGDEVEMYVYHNSAAARTALDIHLAAVEQPVW